MATNDEPHLDAGDSEMERLILEAVHRQLHRAIENRDDARATRAKSFLRAADMKLHPSSLDASDAWELLFRATRSLGMSFARELRNAEKHALRILHG